MKVHVLPTLAERQTSAGSLTLDKLKQTSALQHKNKITFFEVTLVRFQAVYLVTPRWNPDHLEECCLKYAKPQKTGFYAIQ